MSGRLKALHPNDLDAGQRKTYDDIFARRGSVSGLFMAWLRNPELAERAQKLGAYCRYDSTLSPMLSELAILVVARHWKAQAEWAIHAPIAKKEGVPAHAIDSILVGSDPHLSDPTARIVYDYASELLRETRVSAQTHTLAMQTLGEKGVVDLVGLLGYYGLVALTLNAFEVPVPQGSDVPFAE